MASATEEIAIKLGVKTGDLKAALSDAGARINKLKSDSKDGGDGFAKSFARAKQSIEVFKSVLAGAGIVGILKNIFGAAVSYAENYTGAFDESVAATLRVRDAQKELEKTTGKIAAGVVGLMDKFGTAVGALVYGVDAASDALAQMDAEGRKAFDDAQAKKLLEATDKLAKVRREATLAAASDDEKVNLLAAEYVKLLDDQSKLKKGSIEWIEKATVAEAKGAELRKQEAENVKKAADEHRALAEIQAKAAEDDRKDRQLSVDLETELAVLRKKSAADAEAAQTKQATLTTLLNKEEQIGLEIARLKTKEAEVLGPAEAANLATLKEQSETLAAQIEKLELRELSASGITELEAAMLASLRRQITAIDEQIAAFALRAKMAGGLTESEQKALEALEAQASALGAQIVKLDEAKTIKIGDLATTQRMTVAEKERLAVLELQSKAQGVQADIKKLYETMNRRDLTTTEVERLKKLQEQGAALEAQIDARRKISIGLQGDIELLVLQNKAIVGLTDKERGRRAELELMTIAERAQLELKRLHAKLLDETITPAERKRVLELAKQLELLDLAAKRVAGTLTPAETDRLAVLVAQTGQLGRQIIAKADVVKATTSQLPPEQKVSNELVDQNAHLGRMLTEKERIALQTAGVQLSAEQRITAELEEQLRVVEETKKQQAALNDFYKSSIKQEGNVENLNDTQLDQLVQNLNKSLATIKASNINGPRGFTPIEQYLLQQNLDAATKERDLRRRFEQTQRFFGDQFAQKNYAPDEYARLAQLFSPDQVKKDSNNTAVIATGLQALFPDKFQGALR